MMCDKNVSVCSCIFYMDAVSICDRNLNINKAIATEMYGIMINRSVGMQHWRGFYMTWLQYILINERRNSKGGKLSHKLFPLR